jgi:ABC-type glycerol-3-phosphate transport system substrate-binding protein
MQDAADAGRSEDDGWADGMGLLRQIAANARLFTDAAGSLPGWVSSGDVGAAMSIDFFAFAQIDAVGQQRMAYVQPANASAISPDPIAMLAGAPHRETALHFIQFVLSPEGQRLWYTKPGSPGGPRTTALYRMPVQAGLYQSDPMLSGKPDPFTAAGTFNAKRSREKTFGILPMLIQSSCMDTLDELRAARAAIIAGGRSDLDARLGKFPFDQLEALRRARALDALKDHPAERLSLLRSWTAAFRDEYRALREAAAEK